MKPHTPAPWGVSRCATPDYAPQLSVYDEYGQDLAIVKGLNSAANAALIAAAPDMLAALKAALAVCEAEAETRGDNDTDDCAGGAALPVVGMIRAAIARAERG